MPYSGKQHEPVFSSGSEFRDAEPKSTASVPYVSVAYEGVCVAKDTAAVSVCRRLVQVEWASLLTVALLYGIGLVSAWFLSLVVRVHGDHFPFGALTPLQLTAFTLCFFAIGLQASNAVFAWLRCSRETALAIRAASETSAFLLLFFACDRTTLLRRRPRVFNADVFAFLALGFVGAALATTRRIRSLSFVDVDHAHAGLLASGALSPEVPASAGLLHREHIEEWQGWVQLLYALYGYFHNVHIYGVVRVCVSGVTFLTAFLNYLRYEEEVPLQQSVVLLLRSLWKLNFLVVATCALLRNQYMLYHICAVQTSVTVAVYLMLNVGPSLRSSRRVLAVKVGSAVVVGLALWDAPYSAVVFRVFWHPLLWLVRYDNPIVGVEPLHEWHFRSRLDHWIWLVGVAVGHRAAFLNGVLRRLDGQRPVGTAVKAAVACVAGCVLAVYAYFTKNMTTVDYNRWLPYLSWAPILAFVALRSVFRSLRCHHMALCTFLGSSALEVYVAHNHVFMATTGPNGGPLYTLRLLPGDHPLCDFGIFLALLLCVSWRLSLATRRLQHFVLPSDATLLLVMENVVALLVVVTCTYVAHCFWRVKSTAAASG